MHELLEPPEQPTTTFRIVAALRCVTTIVSDVIHPILLCGAFGAAIFAGACDAAPSSPSDDSPESNQRVVVLGDSLAVSPSREESFPAVLQRRIATAGLSWTVTNAGVGGDTTAEGLQRVDALLADDVGVLVLALGANDGLRGIDLMRIEQNLSAII